MKIIYFSMKLKEGTRDSFIDEAKGINIFEKSRGERGNISYDYYLSIDDENEVIGFERWIDDESFQAHLNGEIVKELEPLHQKYLIKLEPSSFDGEQN